MNQYAGCMPEQLAIYPYFRPVLIICVVPQGSSGARRETPVNRPLISRGDLPSVALLDCRQNLPRIPIRLILATPNSFISFKTSVPGSLPTSDYSWSLDLITPFALLPEYMNPPGDLSFAKSE